MNGFNISSGASHQAYAALKTFYRDIVRYNNDYEVAHAEKWLAADDAETNEAVGKMTAARVSMLEILFDPERDIAGLLKEAVKHHADLPPMDQGNLRQMQKIHDEMLAFKPGPGETIEQKIRAYEEPLGHSEQSWIATLDLAEENPSAAFEEQVPHLIRAFKAVGDAMRPVAQARGVSLYEACLQKFCPDKKVGDVEAMFGALNKDGAYQKMARQIWANNARLPDEQCAIPLPRVPAHVQQEIIEALQEEMLKGAGWTHEALAQASVTMKLGTAATGFNWGSPTDISIAVENYEENMSKTEGNLGHETGHTYYLLAANEMPEDMRGQPFATFNGFGAHEFAAMYLEMATLDKRYFELSEPIVHTILDKYGLDSTHPAWSAENRHLFANRPNLNDTAWGGSELVLTPNMVFRFEAERDILNAIEAGDDDLMEAIIRDLPNRYAQTMEEYLGMPHDPADYSVPESHWFEGLMGYFPAYMEGAHAAAQLLHKQAHERAAPDYQGADPQRAQTLSDYYSYHYKTMEPFYLEGAMRPPGESIAAMVGPQSAEIYLSRLASAAQPGMPAPDTLLRQNAGRRPGAPTAATRLKA